MFKVCLRCLILLASVKVTDGSKLKYKLLNGWLHRLTSVLFLRLWYVRGRVGCSLADLQQFFTGKLYVLMYQLKLPAEELLWSAPCCTEDPSTRRHTTIMTKRIQPLCTKILLLMRHVHALRFIPWHLLYHVTKALHHGDCRLCHFGLVFMIAVQFSICI